MGHNNLTPERDWRALAIYQVMVGSFVHSDKGTEGYDDMWGPEGERKDGNLRGVISALDHIAGLGVNAIWLTPIFDSSKADPESDNRVAMIFADRYTDVALPGDDTLHKVSGYIPLLLRLS